MNKVQSNLLTKIAAVEQRTTEDCAKRAKEGRLQALIMTMI